MTTMKSAQSWSASLILTLFLCLITFWSSAQTNQWGEMQKVGGSVWNLRVIGEAGEYVYATSKVKTMRAKKHELLKLNQSFEVVEKISLEKIADSKSNLWADIVHTEKGEFCFMYTYNKKSNAFTVYRSLFVNGDFGVPEEIYRHDAPEDSKYVEESFHFGDAYDFVADVSFSFEQKRLVKSPNNKYFAYTNYGVTKSGAFAASMLLLDESLNVVWSKTLDLNKEIMMISQTSVGDNGVVTVVGANFEEDGVIPSNETFKIGVVSAQGEEYIDVRLPEGKLPSDVCLMNAGGYVGGLFVSSEEPAVVAGGFRMKLQDVNSLQLETFDLSIGAFPEGAKKGIEAKYVHIRNVFQLGNGDFGFVSAYRSEAELDGTHAGFGEPGNATIRYTAGPLIISICNTENSLKSHLLPKMASLKPATGSYILGEGLQRLYISYVIPVNDYIKQGKEYNSAQLFVVDSKTGPMDSKPLFNQDTGIEVFVPTYGCAVNGGLYVCALNGLGSAFKLLKIVTE